MKKADAILVGDVHVRENKPICRTDDWEKTMITKFNFIAETAKKYSCPIICAGDLFHSWNSSPYLLSFALEHLPKMYVIAGNHDMPRHNPELLKWSAFNVLKEAGKIIALENKQIINFQEFQLVSFPFGCDLTEEKIGLQKGKPILAVIHKFISSPNCQDWEARLGQDGKSVLFQLSWLKKEGGKLTVLSGDNHKAFEVKCGNDLLINPGSVFRMTSDQKDFEPRIYLWSANNEYEIVYLPINKSAISDAHIQEQKNEDERILAFVNRIRDDIEIGLDFKQNLREYFSKHNTKIGVETKIWTAMN